MKFILNKKGSYPSRWDMIQYFFSLYCLTLFLPLWEFWLMIDYYWENSVNALYQFTLHISKSFQSINQLIINDFVCSMLKQSSQRKCTAGYFRTTYSIVFGLFRIKIKTINFTLDVSSLLKPWIIYFTMSTCSHYHIQFN